MIFNYHAETDMLQISLADGVSTESEEVASGFVIDFNEQGQVIGIEVEEASRVIDLSQLDIAALPLTQLNFRPPTDRAA